MDRGHDIFGEHSGEPRLCREQLKTMKQTNTLPQEDGPAETLCSSGWFASFFRRKQPALLTPDEVFSRLFRVLKRKDGTAMGAINAKRISELYRTDWERCRDICDMIKADEAEALANT